MAKYLDLTGLTKYNDKIKETYFNKKTGDSIKTIGASNITKNDIDSKSITIGNYKNNAGNVGDKVNTLAINAQGITVYPTPIDSVFKTDGGTITFGKANGLATLDANGKVPLSQLGNIDTTFVEVVTTLPTTNIGKHLYLVADTAAANVNQNKYAEYIYTGTLPISDTNKYDASKWEKLGDFQAEIDLSPYSKKADTVNDINVENRNGELFLSILMNDNSTNSTFIPNASSTTPGSMSTTDKKNLDRLIADTYPFGITSFTNNAGGTLEKGTTKSFNLSWAYKNTDYNPIKSQKVKGGNLSAEVTVANGTLTYAISNLTDSDKTAAKTFTYTLTAVGGSTTKTATTSVTFVHRSYAGVVAASKTALTADDIKALTNTAVQNNKARTISVSQNNQKIAYCYPAYLGNLSSIKDGNGFQGFSGYTKSTVDVDGVTYNVYLQNTAAISNGTYAFA